MKYYAKSDQTYEEHLKAVYAAWKEIVGAKRYLIERVAILYNFSVERFIIGSLLTISFHDIGKMIKPFQEMMLAKNTDQPFRMSSNYRHELISFIFTAKYWRCINREKYLTAIPLEAIAVAGHHKKLDSELNSFDRERLMSMPSIISDGIREAIAIAEKIFQKEGFLLPLLEQIDRVEDPLKSLSDLFAKGIMNKGFDKDGLEKCRVIYSLLKGILHYADWYGSGKKDILYSTNKDIPSFIKDLEKRCKVKGLIFSGLKPFQKICKNHSGHLVTVAPTGSGKTEASLLWALNNVQELQSAKILYFLPTMVTANCIYERLLEFFGKENVGLTHSTANLFLQNSNRSSKEAEEDMWENRRDVLLNQTFMKPITVGTVDQLLTIGFNSGRWVIKETNAANSVIIIDEIHTYKGWEIGLIISAIEHFSSLGTRFMLMSATMTQSIQQLFCKNLKNAMLIKEESLLNAKRSKYFIEDRFISDSIKDIEKAALYENKKILVVVNTVRLCQDLAQKLSHLNPLCYHSQFILRDRKKIEKEINNFNSLSSPHLLIATQVVEVSLDIDYDWLFTECAPPEAIAQRAGRVNRYRDSKRDSRVYLFKPTEKGEKVYNQIEFPDLLTLSFEAFKNAPREISEKNILDILEKVYKGYIIENSKIFKEAVNQYKLSQSNRNMIFDSLTKEDKQETTRQTNYETVSVIPKCFQKEIINLKPSDRQWFEVKIPAWYAKKYKEEINGITYCDIDYDQNIGVIYKDKEISFEIV